MHTQTATIFALAMAFFSTANGAIVQFYSDTACKNAAGSRNVYDNTCAPTGGFQSYKITTGGGVGQVLRAYGPNNCGGAVTSCQAAETSNNCYQATDSHGGSNAIGSDAVNC